MADISTNSNPNNGELVQLEAKRKSDSSWHPCHLSLRPTGGLAVKFEGQDLEDIILNVEDALASLRVRSTPLQGDDCCHIEGKNVLAAYEKNSEKLFFDAVVEKVLRVRHSKRAFCRCSFMVKWLFHHADEISTIPSASIMKLAAESIKSHPIAAEFLDSVALPTSEHAYKLQAEDNCRPEHIRSSTRSRLNPLAARAVLASLVSRTPQKIGVLHQREEKHNSLDFTNGMMMMSPVHKSHHLHHVDDSEPTNIVSNVISVKKNEERGQKADENMLCAKNSRRELNLERDHRNNTSRDCDIPSPLSLTRDEESTQPLRTGRVTRSAIKQENRTSNGEVKSTSLAEDVTYVQEPLRSKPRRVNRADSTVEEIESRISNIEENSQTSTTLTSTTRVTRSAARKQTGTFDGCVKQSSHVRSGVESTMSDYALKDNSVSDFEASEKKRASPLVDVMLKSADINKKHKVSSDFDNIKNTPVETLHTGVENQSPKKRISSQDQLSQSSLQIICGLLAVRR